jgi:hypothetical protein
MRDKLCVLRFTYTFLPPNPDNHRDKNTKGVHSYVNLVPIAIGIMWFRKKWITSNLILNRFKTLDRIRVILKYLL